MSSIQVQEADIADIRQDVMRIVVSELPDFEHNKRKGAFRSWLRRVVANRLRVFRRKRAQQNRAPGGGVYLRLADQLEDENSDLSRIWDQEHDQYVVRSLLESLRSKFRGNTIAAFYHVVLEERPANEVAKELKMSVNAVRIAQARVLQALRLLGKGLID